MIQHRANGSLLYPSLQGTEIAERSVVSCKHLGGSGSTGDVHDRGCIHMVRAEMYLCVKSGLVKSM